MNVNEVRVAEDKDFEVLKIYLSRNDGWMLEYQSGPTSVWTRQAPETDFKMIRVRTKNRSIILFIPVVAVKETRKQNTCCFSILVEFLSMIHIFMSV